MTDCHATGRVPVPKDASKNPYPTTPSTAPGPISASGIARLAQGPDTVSAPADSYPAERKAFV